MKSTVTLLLVSVCAAASSARADCVFPSQPASSYCASGLTSGILDLGFGYRAQDFATSYANQNTSSITVRTRLIANDANFQFVPCGVRGTYTYPDKTIVSLSTDSLNVQAVSVLASGPQFTGSMTAETLGGQTFYIFSPSDFKAGPSIVESTQCKAYYRAWQDSSWTVPFFWDGVAQVLISPYGNYWNNDKFWDKGWNSSLFILNNGAQTVTYEIHYVRDGSQTAVSYNPNNGCSTTSLNQMTTQILPPGGSWSGTLKGILNPNPSHSVTEDGFFYIINTPIIPGTNPSHSLSANASGTSTVCGVSCPLIFSCQ